MHIVELGLQTSRLQELSKFYSEVLELPVTRESASSIAITAGATRLRFTESSSGTNPYYHFAFNIPENLFSVAKIWLKERVPLLEVDGQDEFHFDDWQADAVYFVDPANNIGELIARHTLENASNRPFGSSSLLSVSEIGLVVEDVHDTRVRLNNEMNMEPYFGFTDEFCAVGDENGLIIIVQSGRHWSPKRKVAAQVFPTTIRLSECDSDHFDFHNLPYDIASVSC